MWPYLWKICELSIPHVYAFPAFSPTCFEPFRACFLINTQLTTRCFLCRHIYLACAPATLQHPIMCAYLWKISKLSIPHVYVFPAFVTIVLDSYGTILCFFLYVVYCADTFTWRAFQSISSVSNNVHILVKNLQILIPHVYAFPDFFPICFGLI